MLPCFGRVLTHHIMVALLVGVLLNLPEAGCLLRSIEARVNEVISVTQRVGSKAEMPHC